MTAVAPSRTIAYGRSKSTAPTALHGCTSKFVDTTLEREFRHRFGARWAETRFNNGALGGCVTFAVFLLSRLMSWPYKCSYWLLVACVAYSSGAIIAHVGCRQGWSMGFIASQLFNGTIALLGALAVAMAAASLSETLTRVALLVGWISTFAFGCALAQWTYRLLLSIYLPFLIAWTAASLTILVQVALVGVEAHVATSVSRAIAVYIVCGVWPIGMSTSWIMTRQYRRAFASRKQLQQDLALALEQLKQEQDAAQRVKETTLQAAAHDLRTPISAAIHCMGEVRRCASPLLATEECILPLVSTAAGSHARADGHESSSFAGALAALGDCIDVAETTVSNIIAAVGTGDALEQSVRSSTPTGVNIRQLLHRALLICSKGGGGGSAHEVQIEVHTNVPTAVPLRAEQAVLRMVINLLGNALKYTPPSNGLVGLRAKLRCGGTVLRIEVADNGPGLDDADKGRVFEMHTRVHKDKHRIPGLGIGLASVAKLAGAMGGKCGIRDNPGQGIGIGATSSSRGALFWFEMPLTATTASRAADAAPAPATATAPAATTATTATAETVAAVNEASDTKVQRRDDYGAADVRAVGALDQAPNGGASASVLLVEDTELVREILQQRLVGAGCTVATAANGQEALALLRESRYDHVLCDMNMPPGYTGLETVRQLRQWEESHRPDEPPQPVHILTANVHVRALKEAQQSGLVAGIVDKATPVEALVALVSSQSQSPPP